MDRTDPRAVERRNGEAAAVLPGPRMGTARGAGADRIDRPPLAYAIDMRYLVTARIKDGQAEPLACAIDEGILGAGSIAGGEYLRNMSEARQLEDGRVQWVEVCYCATPLAEERDYWEEYFVLEKVQDAHARSRCRDLSGAEPWACGDCDCTARLEAHLARKGVPFR